MEAVSTIVQALNAITPLGLAAGLAFVIYQLVAKKGQIRAISENHLSGLPAMEQTLLRIEETLGEIRDGINYLKGRLNGR